MGDLSRNDSPMPTQVVGRDESYAMDVELIDGKHRALTSSIVIIEQLFGRDNYADTWFYIGDQYDSSGAGGIGDTVRIQIGEGPDPDYEAIDFTYTLIAADVDDEITLADNIVKALNLDLTFRDKWKATRVKDNSVVHIGAKLTAEFGERKELNDFVVTSTGTTIVTRAWDKIERRGKSTSLTKDSRDPRVGILGISGEFVLGIGDAEKTFQEDAKYLGEGNLAENTYTGPLDYQIDAIASEQVIIKELRLHGVAKGVKFGQFLSISDLVNGLVVSIKTQDKTFVLPPLKTTDDLKSRFASIGGWELDIAAAGDHFLSTYQLPTPLILDPIGTYGIDDYVKITIQDDIDSLDSLYLTGLGFTREP